MDFLTFFLLSTLCIASATPISQDCAYCGKHAPKTPVVSTPPSVTPPVTVPNLPVPNLPVPKLPVPPVTVPKLPVPPVTVPKLPVPPVTVPKLPVPPVSVPKLPVPPVTVPNVPIPPVTVPNVPIPPVTVPNLPVPIPNLPVPLPPISVVPPVSGKGKACSPPAASKCPLNTLKLGACVDLLGGTLPIKVGDPSVNKCCPVISGLVGAEAAVCLCTTLKLKALNLKLYLPIALELLISCGKTPPAGFTCPH